MAQSSGGDKVTRYIVIGMVTLVVAVGVVFSILSNKSGQNAALPASVSSTDGYGVVFNGDLTGVPIVDLWEDFQCPICGQFEKLNGDYIASLIKDKKAKVVYHPLSFIGPESIRAANAAACASDEGKFLDFHKFLYLNQPTENGGVWSNTYLDTSAVAVGIASAKFSECVNGTKYAEWVTNVADDGVKKNINSTPTVFVNGKEIDRKTQYFDATAFAAVVEKG